jgi:hypothetical protein
MYIFNEIKRVLAFIALPGPKSEALYSLLYGHDRALEKWLYMEFERSTECRSSMRSKNKFSWNARENKYMACFDKITRPNHKPESEACIRLFDAVKSKLEAIINEEYSIEDKKNLVYILRFLKIPGLKAALQTRNPYERTIKAVEEFLDDEESEDDEY